MCDKTDTPKGVMTRRALIQMSAVAGIGVCSARQLFGALENSCRHDVRNRRTRTSTSPGELYVFPGRDKNETVVALIWTAPLLRRLPEKSRIRVNVGLEKNLADFVVGNSPAIERMESGWRVFTGEIQNGAVGFQDFTTAVVMQGSSNLLTSSDPTGIWAERLVRGGNRQRFGSPFLNALVSEDEELATIYHAASPAEDRARLMDAVSNAIEVRVRERGNILSPDVHARKLASRLLPDAVHYDPSAPVGFTFAAQNGRHPVDESSVVADTILSGFVGSPNNTYRIPMYEEFPYFRPA